MWTYCTQRNVVHPRRNPKPTTNMVLLPRLGGCSRRVRPHLPFTSSSNNPLSIYSLLGYGVGHINGTFPNWAYIFLILGAFTILWGGVLWFYLPDSLVGAKFLSEREKAIALARVARNKSGISEFPLSMIRGYRMARSDDMVVENKKFKWCMSTSRFSHFTC